MENFFMDILFIFNYRYLPALKKVDTYLLFTKNCRPQVIHIVQKLIYKNNVSLRSAAANNRYFFKIYRKPII